MQENRDHFSSEIKNIYLKYIPCKTLKLYWQSSSCFQCFPFPKKYSLLLSSFSLFFTFFFLLSIYPFMIHSLIHPSIHLFIIHSSFIHPSSYLSIIHYVSVIHSTIHKSSIHPSSSIYHPSSIHPSPIHYLSRHPSNHPSDHSSSYF